MTYNNFINISSSLYYFPVKNLKTRLLLQPRINNNKNIKTRHPLRNKMNENLFASFITPIILGLPLVTLIVLFPSLLFPTSNRLINNRLISLQQWILQLVSKHNKHSQHQRTNMNININVPNPIYWVYKFIRPSTPLIYTNYTTINKSRHGYSFMSRSRNYRLSQLN